MPAISRRTRTAPAQNVSPPLAWINAPDKTRSFALIWDDQAGRAGLGVSHAVIYGIPANVTSFAEGELCAPAGGQFVPGKNTLGMHWLGPCSPQGQRAAALRHDASSPPRSSPNALAPGLTQARAAQGARGRQGAARREPGVPLRALTGSPGRRGEASGGGEAGRVIESTLIIEYLDEAFPPAPLMPADLYLRAAARLWMKKIDDYLHAATSTVTFAAAFRAHFLKLSPGELAERLARIPDPAYRERQRLSIEQGLEAPHVVPALRQFDRYFGEMEEALAGSAYLAGEAYSLAEAAATPYVNRAAMLGMDRLWGRRPRLRSWLERIMRAAELRRRSHGLDERRRPRPVRRPARRDCSQGARNSRARGMNRRPGREPLITMAREARRQG